MMIGLSKAPQTTMFSCSRPTKRRLYRQPMCSFRAVMALKKQKQKKGKAKVNNRLQIWQAIPGRNTDKNLITNFAQR